MGAAWMALPSLAAPAKPAPKPAPKPAENTVKGQNQLAGANGQFGAVYSLKGDFNFSILDAAYTVEPYVAYTPLQAGTETKLFVLDFAIKNVSAVDNFFDPSGFITLVDAGGELYQDGSVSIKSQGLKAANLVLRPGQGRGQPELKDPLQFGWVLPEKARIVKIMINRGRLGKNEEVVRYYVAGATKAEAGEAGDPKNVVRPLPQAVRDPEDPSGINPIAIGKTKIGEFATTGSFSVRCDSLVYTDKALVDEQVPEEGHRFAVATFTARALTPRELPFFELQGGDSPLFQLTDGDGEKVNPITFLKANKGEPADRTFKMQGEEYSFRAVFQIKNDQTVKAIQFGAGECRRWSADVPAAK